jgi:hypothetical protein
MVDAAFLHQQIRGDIAEHRQINHAGRTDGDGDIERGLIVGTGPTAGNHSTHGIIAGVDGSDAADKSGLDDHALKTRSGVIGLDAREVVIEPFGDVAEHEVIL